MKIQGRIKVVLSERPVEVKMTDNEGSGRIGILRKKAFMIEVIKSGKQNQNFKPDTIGMDLVNEKIDEFPIQIGEVYDIIYDSDARVSADNSEIFTKNRVFKMLKVDE